VTSGNYPQLVKFQLVQDRCSMVDPFEEGDQLKIYFDLRGREWNGKYFTNLNAWRIEKAGEAPPEGPPPTEEEGSFPTVSDDPGETADDDLPF
jgi:single-strand DNA-binding protein